MIANDNVFTSLPSIDQFCILCKGSNTCRSPDKLLGKQSAMSKEARHTYIVCWNLTVQWRHMWCLEQCKHTANDDTRMWVCYGLLFEATWLCTSLLQGWLWCSLRTDTCCLHQAHNTSNAATNVKYFVHATDHVVHTLAVGYLSVGAQRPYWAVRPPQPTSMPKNTHMGRNRAAATGLLQSVLHLPVPLWSQSLPFFRSVILQASR